MGEPLAAAMAADPQPAAGRLLFDQMMRDITGGGGCADPMGQVRGHLPAPGTPCKLAPGRCDEGQGCLSSEELYESIRTVFLQHHARKLDHLASG